METSMRKATVTAFATALMLASCNQPQPQKQTEQQEPQIKVRGSEQDQLHQLNALNLAIALKRAIYDSGYSCSRIDKAGFVGEYKNLDEWTAHCSNGRNWAIFAGPDGRAQVRDCADVVQSGLPKCEIHQAPKGSPNEVS
jgi:hypothetical protein